MFRSYSDHLQGAPLLKSLILKFVKNAKVVRQHNIWCVYMRSV